MSVRSDGQTKLSSLILILISFHSLDSNAQEPEKKAERRRLASSSSPYDRPSALSSVSLTTLPTAVCASISAQGWAKWPREIRPCRAEQGRGRERNKMKWNKTKTGAVVPSSNLKRWRVSRLKLPRLGGRGAGELAALSKATRDSALANKGMLPIGTAHGNSRYLGLIEKCSSEEP
ncbi:hypothetical protein BDP67DRAFT_519422 [Colletotrichum lupini]|nr:hypothetical protein BDP67DRAFT_519422 [Colletotrichum lupini]